MTDTTIVRDLDLDNLVLKSGGHTDGSDEFCVMEAVAYVAGEPWSDHPKCASQTIGAFARSFNDNLDDEGRQRLAPFVLKMVGTNTGPEDEDKRRWLVADWMTHVHLPTWLDAARMTEQAEQVRALPKIESYETLRASRAVIDPIREAAWAKRQAVMVPLRAKVREAVKAKMAERPVAAAAAVADAAPYTSTWRAVYDATKPIFKKAIDEHPVVGPAARSMKDSGFELLEQLCAIGR